MANELVLLFEDSDGIVEFYRDIMEVQGKRVRHYFKPGDFFDHDADVARLLDESALVWTDGDIPNMHGLELARKLRLEHDYDKPIVYNSGRLAEHEVADLEVRKVTRADGSNLCLVNKALIKPVDMKTIYKTLDLFLAPKP